MAAFGYAVSKQYAAIKPLLGAIILSNKQCWSPLSPALAHLHSDHQSWLVHAELGLRTNAHDVMEQHNLYSYSRWF